MAVQVRTVEFRYPIGGKVVFADDGQDGQVWTVIGHKAKWTTDRGDSVKYVLRCRYTDISGVIQTAETDAREYQLVESADQG